MHEDTSTRRASTHPHACPLFASLSRGHVAKPCFLSCRAQRDRGAAEDEPTEMGPTEMGSRVLIQGGGLRCDSPGPPGQRGAGTGAGMGIGWSRKGEGWMAGDWVCPWVVWHRRPWGSLVVARQVPTYLLSPGPCNPPLHHRPHHDRPDGRHDTQRPGRRCQARTSFRPRPCFAIGSSCRPRAPLAWHQLLSPVLRHARRPRAASPRPGQARPAGRGAPLGVGSGLSCHAPAPVVSQPVTMAGQ